MTAEQNKVENPYFGKTPALQGLQGNFVLTANNGWVNQLYTDRALCVKQIDVMAFLEAMTHMVCKGHPDKMEYLVNTVPGAIQYFDDPPEHVILAALKKDKEVIKHVKHPSVEAQLLVGIDHIDDIKDPCFELQYLAVQKSRMAIYKFTNTYEKVIDLHKLMWEI